MSNLRHEFEERVRLAEEELQQAQRELRWLNKRSEGCICDPRDWGSEPGPMCSQLEPDPDPNFAEYCKKCQHPIECH
jgi:hypothetical protein